MTTTLTAVEPPPQNLPADLRASMGEGALSEWARAAAQTVAAGLPSWPGMPAGEFSAPMLLRLLTYCYAAGNYASEDIECDCQNDPTLRHLSANTCPDQDTIRRFRRANRPWIEACLACVYGWACGVTPAPTSRRPSPIPQLKARSSAELLRVARRKLELAIMIDTAMSK